jgi:hypothetical protein
MVFYLCSNDGKRIICRECAFWHRIEDMSIGKCTVKEERKSTSTISNEGQLCNEVHYVGPKEITRYWK